MKNPLRELSRPKALAVAGIVAGAVALSGAAAALNVGLLTGHDRSSFTPQTVVGTATEPSVDVVYKDVYEQVPGPSTTTVQAPASSLSSSDDSGDDAYDDHGDDAEDHGHDDEDHDAEDEESDFDD